MKGGAHPSLFVALSFHYSKKTSINIKHKILLSIYKKENILNFIPNVIMSAIMELFLGTQVRVRNSRSKRAISVRATDVLL